MIGPAGRGSNTRWDCYRKIDQDVRLCITGPMTGIREKASFLANSISNPPKLTEFWKSFVPYPPKDEKT